MSRIRVTAIDYSEVKGNYERLLDSISERATELSSVIDDIDDEVELLEKRKTIEKESFLQAVEFVSENSLNYLKAAVTEAMYKTFEYNYQPYVEHMMRALELNYEEMITIKPYTDTSFTDITVTANFDVLGDIELWANAVKRIRDSFPHKVTEDANAASRMWREKIFKTAREGGKVYRRKKDKETKKTVKVDVTEKYIGRYYATITDRLSLIEEDKAPFWYLIQNGNKNISAFEKGGFPYPESSGFDMVGKVEEVIKEGYKDAYNKFKDEVEDAISNKLWGEYGFEGAARGVDYVEEELVNEIRGRFSERKEWEVEVGAVIDIVKGVDRTYEFYKTSANNVAARARGAKGQFVSLVNK